MLSSTVVSPPAPLPCLASSNSNAQQHPHGGLLPRRNHVNYPSITLPHLVALSSPRTRPTRNAVPNRGQKQEQEQEEEQEYEVLTCVRSVYNDIVIVDTPKARMLLLDSTGNVHSVLNKGEKWTGSYWRERDEWDILSQSINSDEKFSGCMDLTINSKDQYDKLFILDEFASLPAIIPEGPIAIFGLGGGTAAHLMLDSFPSLELEGWEIDEILIHKAREYFGLSDLEKPTQAGGRLHVHIGDALSPLENNCQRYSGIIVDLFSEGNVLAQLQKVETWVQLKDRLITNGRLMVNCGAVCRETDFAEARIHSKSVMDAWLENSVIKALSKAFPGQLSWRRMPEIKGANYLALTGPLPDLTFWSAVVPSCLSESVYQWRPCDPHS